MELDLLISYIALLTHAVIPILIGSFQSLKPTQVESLAEKDAYMFPVIGSCVLFSLYICFKFLSEDWVNFIMSAYFTVLGVGAIATFLHPILSKICPYEWTDKAQESTSSKKKKKYSYHLKVPIVGWELDFTLIDVIGTIIGGCIGIVYLLTKHWITNNIFGLCFSTVSIQLIQLGSYKVGAILLIGLFFYDIFWVFGTDVMITVAKKFDAPIKVLWPKGNGFSLLGLGDIVIPGIFVALMLRFDYYLYKKKKEENALNENTNVKKSIRFDKSYFWSTFISYVIGLVLTVTVLHIFRHGQPALLYIVPCVLIGSLGCAVVKGDASKLFGYHDNQLFENQVENKTNENEEVKTK
ncbi:hypothetical protein ABK040_016350 [Willaertia magna]